MGKSLIPSWLPGGSLQTSSRPKGWGVVGAGRDGDLELLVGDLRTAGLVEGTQLGNAYIYISNDT